MNQVFVSPGAVPGVANGHAAAAVRAFVVDLLELGLDVSGLPAHAEGQMDGVHAQVAHHAARFDLAFPVGGLGGVEVAAVMEARVDFRQGAETALAGGL